MNKWKNYIDDNGNFQLGNYIYRTINELMKNSLDMGTLLSDDTQKLRAYKEQTKKLFKSKWYEIAECLEYLDVIEKCICFSESRETYCDICKGARYSIAKYLTSNEITDVSTFISSTKNKEIADRLQDALIQVLDEMSKV